MINIQHTEFFKKQPFKKWKRSKIVCFITIYEGNANKSDSELTHDSDPCLNDQKQAMVSVWKKKEPSFSVVGNVN